MSEYEDYFKDAFKEVDPRIVETAKNIDFHDCKITRVFLSPFKLIPTRGCAIGMLGNTWIFHYSYNPVVKKI